MVLETETEYHDVFKQIMLAMFDLIRVPPEAYNNSVAKPTEKGGDMAPGRLIINRNLAFADLVAHIAFLKTIPAPPFNSVYNI